MIVYPSIRSSSARAARRGVVMLAVLGHIVLHAQKEPPTPTIP